MKISDGIGLGFFLFLSLGVPLGRAQAQPLTSGAECGNFYSAQHPDWPPLPFNIYGLPVQALGSDAWLMDDSQVDYASLMTPPQMQAMASSQDQTDPPGPGEGSGGNITPADLPPPIHTSNDLWLEISLTNAVNSTGVTNPATAIVIHPQAGVNQGMYAIFYAFDLTPPIAWGTLAVTAPGQTNLLITNLTNPLGVTNVNNPNGFFRAALVTSTNLVVSYTNMLSTNVSVSHSPLFRPLIAVFKFIFVLLTICLIQSN